MDHLLDDDDATPRKDREVTLSTGTILGLFFGLVLLCGLFLGLGYNLGSHKGSANSADATANPSISPTTNFNAFKPAAGSPIAAAPGTQALPAASTTTAPSAPSAPSATHPSTIVPPQAAANSEGADESATPIVRGSPTEPAHSVAPVGVIASPAGSFTVQVAAVSHQEDADLLVTALKARGYSVAARSEPQDHLVHIQIGPFSNRKDAETMRQRLLNDGYNAIIK
jgi:DedD protein